MRLFTQVLFFSFMCLISLPSVARFATPEKIMQQVQERGVNAVVAELSEEREWSNITHNISTGDSQWVQLAFKLSQNIHPTVSKQITNAISLALVNNPAEVLELTNKHRVLSFADICNIPPTIIGTSKKRAFFKDVMDSLKEANKSNFGKNRDNIETCRWEIEKAASIYF
ncbi:hypothetical protein [Xenorhabdus miraniensis]|uniref:Uncharacterized protein n=1 Tax=Xenorhabdus miraniensis TaxID=351674 RepID=A0A2D0JL09_9GAMM|nr:hypothetical protein [Xenorhabdus miraniensis]PHM46990.1 hypothetical protein Xmir_03686 [Xenorhabdus miraniensis]